MADKKERKGLGRGLSALMADIEPSADAAADRGRSATAEQEIPIGSVFANPDQPRRSFAEAALEELATSIRDKGIIQPLILRPNPDRAGTYQIVAGERRWRAAQRAQLHSVPAIIREFDDTETLQVAIIENIQRSDLNPLEEAEGYRQLMTRFDHTQEQLASAMGKSRSHIANLMRLLQLPDPVQEMVRAGDLSAGHARALITSPDPLALAQAVVKKGLSVRQTERLAKTTAGPRQGQKSTQKGQKDADTVALEGDLSAALGMPVSIDHDAPTGEGRLSIHYKSLQSLDDLIRLLGGG